MKNASIATGLAVAALSVVSSARAVPIYQNLAGITQARNGTDEQYIRRAPDGVSNAHATLVKDVVVTPPRTRLDEGVANVTVRIALTKEVTAVDFRCRVDFVNTNGTVAATKQTGTATVGQTGPRSIQAVFRGSEDEVPVGYNAIVVTCPLAPNNTVTLRDVRVL